MKSAVILTMDPETGQGNIEKIGPISTRKARNLCRSAAEVFTDQLIEEKAAALAAAQIAAAETEEDDTETPVVD
jgi:hypothetical protein